MMYKYLKKFFETPIKLKDKTFISFQVKAFVKHTANYEETIEANINIKENEIQWNKGEIIIATYNEMPRFNIKGLVIRSDNIDEINEIITAIKQRICEINKEIENGIQNS